MQMPDNAEIFGVDQDDSFLSLTRARFMPTLNFDTDTKIVAQYEIDLMISKSPVPLMNLGGETNRQAVDLNWTPIDEDNTTLTHYVDMLYFKKMFGFGEIAVGRQVVARGVGRVWQPTDRFNPINPANFSKFERDGADAVSAKVYLGAFSDVEAVYNFRETWDQGNFGARYRTNVGEFDLSAMGGYFDKRVEIGGDFAGNLFEAGVRGEILLSMNKDDLENNYPIYILGADYQFTSKLYALVEYKHSGLGTDDKSKYIAYLDRLARGEIQNIGIDYFATQANYQVHPLVTATGMNIVNLNDRSGFFGGTAKWNALENLNIALAAMIVYGKKGSEYAFYGNSIYLIGEYYF